MSGTVQAGIASTEASRARAWSTAHESARLEAADPSMPTTMCSMGCSFTRALDNLGRPSAEAVLPELQHLEAGQWVPMSPTPSETTAFKVAAFEPNRLLVWEQPGSTWVWTLTATPDGATRLVTRLRILYDWRHPVGALFSLVLNEFGDFPMMRRMLLGLKRRAEAT